jgi:sporulation integral membrane protein YlbJ
VGAIGVGMFANPAAGYLLAIAHYLSNLLVGLLWRFKSQPQELIVPSNQFRGDLIYTDANTNQTIPSLGKILGDSIKNSLNNIFAVGGFIIIFSVLTRMLSSWGIIDIMATGLLHIFAWLNLSYPLAYGLSMGFFEITLGAKTTIASDPASLPALLIVSSILGFSGLSIIAQIMSVVAGTPIRLSFYLFSRSIQVLISLVITYVFFRFFFADSISTVGFMLPPAYKILYSFNAWAFSLYSLLAGLIIILVLLGLAWCKRYQ